MTNVYDAMNNIQAQLEYGFQNRSRLLKALRAASLDLNLSHSTITMN